MTGWGRNGTGNGNNTTSWEASLQAAAGQIANIPNAGTNAEAWNTRNVNTPSSSTGPQSGTQSSDGTTGNHAYNTPSGYFAYTETSSNNNANHGRFTPYGHQLTTSNFNLLARTNILWEYLKETISVRIKDTDDQIQQTLATLNQLLGYKKAC